MYNDLWQSPLEAEELSQLGCLKPVPTDGRGRLSGYSTSLGIRISWGLSHVLTLHPSFLFLQ